MALFMNQENTRTKLQQKIAADLAEKAKKKAGDGSQADRPDGVEDSAYIEGSKQTTSLAWAWVLIVIAIVIVAVWLASMSI